MSFPERAKDASLVHASGSVVTIGTYDGVHLGHRRLIEISRTEAALRGQPVVVVTFDRPPASVLRPEDPPKLLTGLDHKVELLKKTGVEDVVVLAFDATRAAESAEDFISSVLVEELRASCVVVGANFRFGNKHRGDIALLKQAGQRFGFETIGVDLVTDEKTRVVVSATRIRSFIDAALLEDAARFLGRPHELRAALAAPTASSEGSVRVMLDADCCVPPPGEYEACLGMLGGDGLLTTVRISSEVSIDIAQGDAEAISPQWRTTPTRIFLQLLSVADRRAPRVRTTHADDAR